MLYALDKLQGHTRPQKWQINEFYLTAVIRNGDAKSIIPSCQKE